MSLYETDFYEWTEATARALREGTIDAADVETVAEEIESMGKDRQQELESRLTQILEHALKLRLTSGQIQAYNQGGWRGSISRQQYEIELLLAKNPSLRRRVPEFLPGAYKAARRTVARQFNLAGPAECPWTAEGLLNDDIA